MNSSAPPSLPVRVDPAPPVVPRTILYLWITFLASSALIWITCFIYKRLGYGYPYSTPFPTTIFEDLRIYLGRFETFHTAQFFEYSRHSHFAYPAGAAVIYKAFYATNHVRSTYCYLSLAWAIFGAAFLTRALLRRGVSLVLALALSVTCCVSYPFMFLIQRGNIEIALWIISSFGILAYMRKQPYVAAILWGMAAAIKIYPIFLLGIFLGRRCREIGPLLAGIASALLTTLACLVYVGPSVGLAFRGFLGGVQGFQGAYAETVRSSSMGYDHSLFSPFKLFAVSIGHLAGPWLHPYYVIAGTVATLLFLLRVRKLPFANRLTFLTVAFVLLPPVSYEYTLVHLYVPGALLLLYALQPRTATAPSRPQLDSQPNLQARSLLLALASILVIFLPINLFIVHGILFAGQAQIVPLLLLAALAALHPWNDPIRIPYRYPAQPDLAPQPS